MKNTSKQMWLMYVQEEGVIGCEFVKEEVSGNSSQTNRGYLYLPLIHNLWSQLTSQLTL